MVPHILSLLTCQGESAVFLDNRSFLDGGVCDYIGWDHVEQMAQVLSSMLGEPVLAHTREISDDDLRAAGICPDEWNWTDHIDGILEVADGVMRLMVAPTPHVCPEVDDGQG